MPPTAASALQSMTGGHKSFREILTQQKHPFCESIKEGSTHKGERALLYTSPEVQDLSSHLQLTLIGKFENERPSMEFLRRGFKTIGFSGEFFIGLLDENHVMIQFDQADDYNRCWLHREWKFRTHTMRILKWTPKFHIDKEPPFAPVWVSLEGLPLFLFSKGPMFSLGKLIGNPLKLDAATENLTRPSVARICVEINLLKPLPRRIWIGHGDSGFWQSIKYDHLPSYCSACCRFGHLKEHCGKQMSTAPAHNASADLQSTSEVPRHLQAANKQTWQQKRSGLNETLQGKQVESSLNLVEVPVLIDVEEPTHNNESPAPKENTQGVCKNAHEISVRQAKPAVDGVGDTAVPDLEMGRVDSLAVDGVGDSFVVPINEDRPISFGTGGVRKNDKEKEMDNQNGTQCYPEAEPKNDDKLNAQESIVLAQEAPAIVQNSSSNFVAAVETIDQQVATIIGDEEMENTMAPTQKATALNPNASEFQFPKVAVNEIERVPSNPTDERQTANFYIELNPNMGKSVVNLTSEEIDAIREEVQRSMYHEDFTQGFNESQFEDDLEDEEWIQEEEEVYWDNEFIRDDSYLRRGRGRPPGSCQKKASVPHSMRRRSSKSLD